MICGHKSSMAHMHWGRLSQSQPCCPVMCEATIYYSIEKCYPILYRRLIINTSFIGYASICSVGNMLKWMMFLDNCDIELRQLVSKCLIHDTWYFIDCNGGQPVYVMCHLYDFRVCRALFHEPIIVMYCSLQSFITQWVLLITSLFVPSLICPFCAKKLWYLIVSMVTYFDETLMIYRVFIIH